MFSRDTRNTKIGDKCSKTRTYEERVFAVACLSGRRQLQRNEGTRMVKVGLKNGKKMHNEVCES